MQINMSASVNSKADVRGIINRLKSLDNQEVEAGVMGGFAQKKAMWNEYGTSRIPARPFLRNTLYENEHSWSSFIAPKVLGLMNGGSAVEVIATLGPQMVKDIRATIDAGNFAPLAPSTVRQKGSSTPLIDTGEMYGAITWRQGGDA